METLDYKLEVPTIEFSLNIWGKTFWWLTKIVTKKQLDDLIISLKDTFEEQCKIGWYIWIIK